MKCLAAFLFASALAACGAREAPTVDAPPFCRSTFPAHCDAAHVVDATTINFEKSKEQR